MGFLKFLAKRDKTPPPNNDNYDEQTSAYHYANTKRKKNKQHRRKNSIQYKSKQNDREFDFSSQSSSSIASEENADTTRSNYQQHGTKLHNAYLTPIKSENQQHHHATRTRYDDNHSQPYQHPHVSPPFNKQGQLSDHSSQKNNKKEEALTLEELFELPARTLRKKCHELGLDVTKAVQKQDLVYILHDYYCHFASNTNPTIATTNINSNSNKSPYPFHHQQHNHHPNHMPMLDETQQMIEVLFEVLPFYGQGDHSIDSIVTETLQRLPSNYLDTTDSMGNSIMLLCCQYGAFDLVPLLLSLGSDPNAQNNDGVTCLHYASYSETYSLDAATALLESGALTEISEERFGCTPLHWAASIGNLEICNLLVLAGAQVSTLDKNGHDTIFYARQSKKMDCVDFLSSLSSNKKSSWNNTMNDQLYDFEWERLHDNRTGYVYYRNRNTGQALWEDDFLNRKFQEGKVDSDVQDEKNDSSFHHQPPEKKKIPLQSHLGKEYPLKDMVAKPESKGSVPSSDNKKCNEQNAAKSQHTSKDMENRSSLIVESIRSLDEAKVKTLVPSPEGRSVSSHGTAGSKNSHSDSSVSKNSENKKKGNNHKKNISRHKAPLRISSITVDPDNVDIDYSTPTHTKTSSSQLTERRDDMKDATSVSRSLSSIDSSKRDMSSTTTPKKIASSNVADDQLNFPHSRLQEQFLEQLNRIETKLTSKHVEEKMGNSSLLKNYEELTAKIVQLQTELGSKDLEIQSLRRDLMTIEMTSCKTVTDIVDKQDAIVGDDDVTEFFSLSDKEILENIIESKSKEIMDLEQELDAITSKLEAVQNLLQTSEETQSRIQDQLSLTESLLNEEKISKTEIMNLLEQTQKGLQIDTEVTQAIKEENKRNEETVQRLLDSLKEQEEKSKEIAIVLNQNLEEERKRYNDENMKVKSLTLNLQDAVKAHNDEKDKLIVAHKHQLQSIERNETIKYEQLKQQTEKEIQEERRLKLKIEAERNQAVRAYEEALQRKNIVESQLQEMTDLVNDAKTLIGVNEKLYRSLHTETEKRKALHNQLEDLKGKIRVYVRIRPLSTAETARKCVDALTKEDKRSCAMFPIDGKSGEVKRWEFDQVFCGSAQDGNSQEDIFRDTRRLVTSSIDGFNVCIFAYGQTGSGKTYTMFGSEIDPGSIISTQQVDEHAGLAPRVAVDLFRLLEEREMAFEFSVHVTMFELYNDNLRDLLAISKGNSSEQLRIKLSDHTGSGMVEVEGATMEVVQSAADLLSLFKQGSNSRTTSSTQMNADSSRSHLITSMILKLVHRKTNRITGGKLTLVDLAGSERVSKSGATGQQLKEAQSINKSLSALGDVINALTSGSKHIPYRNHPLTMLMSDSIGGNAKTLMFVCCSPADYNRSETANSLDFGKRCKDVKNKVASGVGNESTQVKALKAELARMKQEKGNDFPKKASMPNRYPGM